MPFGPLHPSLFNTSSPWYLSCQQEKVTTLFFSPPVLPSCPSPNLSSYLTLILTHGFGPGNRGQWEKGQGKTGMGWGPGGLGKAEFWYFPPALGAPQHLVSFNFHGFRIEGVQSSGYALDLQGPLAVPCLTQKPWGGWELGLGREARRDSVVRPWTPVVASVPVPVNAVYSLFCPQWSQAAPTTEGEQKAHEGESQALYRIPVVSVGCMDKPYSSFSDLGVGCRNMRLHRYC